jgi:DNA-binding CsgD family transcriptional regulator
LGAEQAQSNGLPERQLADRLMSIAESRSVRALGVACCAAITELTGSPTVGLYLLDGPEPELAYRRHVADGLLDNYQAGFWRRDPVLDCVMTCRRVADGATLVGPRLWRQSPSFEVLHEWGLAYNMAGPLWCDDTIIGVLFTATSHADTPYTPQSRERMEMLCRAGSLALNNMTNNGEIDARRGAVRSLEQAGAPVKILPACLPPRSADVAVRVCRGQTNKQIAREMGISDQTVKEHVANLCRRFGVHNRTELAAHLSAPGAA